MKRYYVLIFCAVISIGWTNVEFDRDFAPQEGVVTEPELPFRDELCLNGKWDFQPVYEADSDSPFTKTLVLPEPDEAKWEKTPIKIPSPWNVNSFTLKGDMYGENRESGFMGGHFTCYPSYPARWDQAKMGWLRKTFAVPKEWKGKRIHLQFKAVAGDCKVFVNGEQVGTNFDAVLPFTFDVTEHIRWDKENELLVGIRKHELFKEKGKYGELAYATGSFWQMHIVGIWQDVFLLAVPQVHISNVYVKPQVSKNRLSIKATIKNNTDQDQTVSVQGAVHPWINHVEKKMLTEPEIQWSLGKKVLTLKKSKGVIPAGQDAEIALSILVDDKLKYWTCETPNLYGLVLTLEDSKEGIDKKYTRFGWREFKIKGKDLLLNGEKIQLLGDAWHFMGIPQMTRRYAWAWYQMVRDAGGNSLRLHAMIYPEFYLDMADEMGIAILDESSIWASHCNHNYDSKLLWESFRENVRGLILRDRNHPSVFGWSVANEIKPALNVVCKDRAYKEKVYDRFEEIANLCRRYDPTRDWISIDGDHDLDSRLPTCVVHYGSAESYLKEAAEMDKPFGVGEATIGYYGTPTQAEKYVGDRAYRSFKDRMDGVAINAYDLIANAQRQVAAFCSIFNLAWYGCQALELGIDDVTQAPDLKDGIFFTKEYEEGKPGVQPERLGPYTTTLNPGYDPSLPLYRPWPLFHAVKAAYAPVPQPCEWDERQDQKIPKPPRVNNPAEKVSFIGKKGSDADFTLRACGIPIIYDRDAQFTIVDCQTLEASKELKEELTRAVQSGATVFFWNLTPDRCNEVSKLLPYPVQAFDRDSTSLIPDEKDNRVNSISYRDYYFTENEANKMIMQHGLKGEFVKRGHVLLQACRTDWRKWNQQGEDYKIASILRSERENLAGPCLVEMKQGQGRYLVSTLYPKSLTTKHMQVYTALLMNMGVKIKGMNLRRGGLLDQSFRISRALLSGGYEADGYEQALDTDFLGSEHSKAPALGKGPAGYEWKVYEADSGMYNFRKKGIKNDSTNFAAVYLSFWVFSPKPLDQLLASPDIPKVHFKFGADDGPIIWLNGEKVFQDRTKHPATPDAMGIDQLPLKKGWNHFLIKVCQGGGDWKFTGRFVCEDYDFLSSLRAVLDPHSEKANFYEISHNDSSIEYDNDWSLNGDGWHESSKPGSKCSFSFLGTGFSLRGKVAGECGSAKIYIDGVFDQTVSLKRAVRQFNTEYYTRSNLPYGEHTVTIEVDKGWVTLSSMELWESAK